MTENHSQITELYIDREKLKRKKKFKTCEGDSIFLVGRWRTIRELIVDRTHPLFEFGETFEDGESDLQDSRRLLRYFNFENKMWPLTEFGLFRGEYDVQIISFEHIIPRQIYGHKLKSKKVIHFINGYCMSKGMEWMLIEIDSSENRLRVFECNPDCVW